jgi:hypothetical protein
MPLAVPVDHKGFDSVTKLNTWKSLGSGGFARGLSREFPPPFSRQAWSQGTAARRADGPKQRQTHKTGVCKEEVRSG